MQNLDLDRYWTAFYVKARTEKKVSERLSEQGYNIYCPVIEEIRLWSDRKKKVKMPLFKSYLFAQVDEKERLEILQDSGVVSNVRWLGKPALIREAEIDAIKLLIGESNDIQIEEYINYKKGELVEIQAGPFEGNKAIVADIKRNKVLVQLEGIQMQMAITLSPEKVRKKGLV